MAGVTRLLSSFTSSCRCNPLVRNSVHSRAISTFLNASAKASQTPAMVKTSLTSLLANNWKGLSRTSQRRFYSIARNQISVAGRPIQPRFFSSNMTFASTAGSAANLPVLSPPSVGYWLLACSLLAYGVIVVGGVTRLTESGLSITEWKPVTGVLPPLNQAEWEEEFTKYKATPEFKL